MENKKYIVKVEVYLTTGIVAEASVVADTKKDADALSISALEAYKKVFFNNYEYFSVILGETFLMVYKDYISGIKLQLNEE